MSEDKIEVSMNIYDIPIVVEELEKEEPNIKKLIEKYKEIDIEEETNEKVD